MPTNLKPSQVKPSQWRLSTLFIMILGFAVLFTGVARIHGRVDIRADFRKLPENDASLERWLKDTYRVRDISIKRPSDTAVAVSFSRPLYSFEVPSPPWDKLGYTTLGSFNFRQDSVVGWWIPIGILIIGCAGHLTRSLSALMQVAFRPRHYNSSDTHSLTSGNR